MKADAADNTAAAVTCGANVAWINGNIVVDRDRFGLDRKFGVSIAGGAVVFGVSGDGTGDRTICGSRDVLDSRWHHVAVERRRSDGRMRLFVDGILDAEGDGPDGDVSYPDDATPAAPNDPFLVFGAEKHDADPVLYPSYDGFLDEIRLSKVLRYTSGFTRPRSPFTADADTAALYHLDEATGDADRRRLGGRGRAVRRAAPLRRLAGRAGVVDRRGAARRQRRDHVHPGDRRGVSEPVQVTHAPATRRRLFIVSQGGTIRIVKNGTAAADAVPEHRRA